MDNDRIVDVGPAGQVAGRHKGTKFDQVIDGRMLGICPGFVDSHVHLSETLSRAVFPDNLNTRAWVFHWAKPFYAAHHRRGRILGRAAGHHRDAPLRDDVLHRHGLAVRSRHHGPRDGENGNPRDHRPARGRQSAGRAAARLDARRWRATISSPSTAAALAELEACVRKYDGALDGRVRCWVNIEGKEPCTLELHVGAQKLAERLGVGTTYHLATSIEEARVCEDKYGCWPITRIDRAGGIGSNLVIAHGAAVADDEVALLARRGTKVAFCPCSSFKLGKGATAIGKYPEMVKAGVTVGLGSDGVSAAGNMNLMRQMLLVAGMFKDARMKPDIFTARQALRAATIEGAKAALWDHDIGSLEIGKKADFVLFDLDHIEWTPFHDPLQALVFSASTASIAQTWVDGKALYSEGKVHGIDEPALRKKARELAAAAVVRAGLHKEDVATTTTLYDSGN